METTTSADKIIVTPELFLRLARTLRQSASGMGEVRSIKGQVYYLGTEVESLRALAVHRFNKDARQGYSANLKSSYFSVSYASFQFPCDYSAPFNSSSIETIY